MGILLLNPTSISSTTTKELFIFFIYAKLLFLPTPLSYVNVVSVLFKIESINTYIHLDMFIQK
jgi:ABC-type arginine transport system permease subunit